MSKVYLRVDGRLFNYTSGHNNVFEIYAEAAKMYRSTAIVNIVFDKKKEESVYPKIMKSRSPRLTLVKK